MAHRPIENHAMIGEMQSAAMAGTNGLIFDLAPGEGFQFDETVRLEGVPGGPLRGAAPARALAA